MRSIKVGDTVRITYNDERDNTLYACIFNGEICTVTDISVTAAIVTSEAVRKYMHENGFYGAHIVCDLKYLIPVPIYEEDIDTTYDVLM